MDKIALKLDFESEYPMPCGSIADTKLHNKLDDGSSTNNWIASLILIDGELEEGDELRVV